MTREKDTPVKKYWLKCTSGTDVYEYTILAKNSDWALTMCSRECDWDTITLRKLSDVIALASYGARDISGESKEQYLYYHAKPIQQKGE